MTSATPKDPPKKRGRPPLPAEHRKKTARMELRLTVAQRATVDRHGGPAWVNRLIDDAGDADLVMRIAASCFPRSERR